MKLYNTRTLRKETINMLIDELTSFCDVAYRNMNCQKCNHPNNCPNNCGKCLDEVHFHNGNSYKRYYDCPRMINFYVCRYTHKYASEVYYLLSQSSVLNKMDKWRIISAGCGGCSDLIAFDTLARQQDKNFHYVGADINPLWKPVHDFVGSCVKENSTAKFTYSNALDLIFAVKDKFNVLMLNYIISSIYHYDRAKAEKFMRDIYDLAMCGKFARPFIIAVNDVNHTNEGRDLVNCFAQNLYNYFGGNNIFVQRYYFPYGAPFRYGRSYENYELIYPVPNKLCAGNYGIRPFCTSAQTLIELY